MTPGYLSTHRSSRTGFTTTQMMPLLSSRLRWTVYSDDFHAFKTSILKRIAVMTFQLINQWSQTAVTFHEQLRNEVHASFNGNQ